jgi:hypothetical protein
VRGVAVSAALALSLLTSAIVSARADDIPPCPVPPGVTSISRENAPRPLLRALKAQIGDLAPPGGKFDVTDALTHPPPARFRRLIFIRNAGRRWVVATERGGRGYSDPIFAYDLSPDGQKATLAAERSAAPETVCSTVNDLLKAP